LHKLIKRYQPATSQEYRWLSFWGKNNAQRTIYLDSINEEAFPQNSLVAIEITQNKASDTFLKSILEISDQGAIEIKNTLRQKNLAVICYFKGWGQVPKLTQQKRGSFGFHYWDTSPPINTLQEFIAAFDYSKLYDQNHSVFKYILYVATFFPRTSPKEFKKIVDVLLSEKKDEILADATREVSEKDEVLKRTEELKTRSLLYLWEQQTDDFFKECGLTIEQENDLQKVDFADTREREAYKIHFKSKMPFFLLEQFDNLVNSGLPFAPDTSNQVVEYFIQIACELAKNDPYFYGTKLLHEVSSLFKTFAADATLPEFISTLQTFLIELTYAMLKLDNVLLTERIDSFLFEHLDYRYFINKTPHNLLADITFELRSMEMFDKYRWIEMMMTFGKKETVVSAYQLLLQLANSYKENMQDIHTDFFEKSIKKWLPRGAKAIPWEQKDTQSKIESYALSFIIDYWEFYDLEKSNILVSANPDFLIGWLFDPDLEVGYYNRSRYVTLRDIRSDGSKQGRPLSVDQQNITQVVDKARAILTEIWFRKLTFQEEEKAATQGFAESVPKESQMYVELFCQYTNTRQRETLIREWRKQTHSYLQQSNDLNQYDKKERKQKREKILARRKTLQSLIRQFSKLAGPVNVSSNAGCFPFAGLFKR